MYIQHYTVFHVHIEKKIEPLHIFIASVRPRAWGGEPALLLELVSALLPELLPRLLFFTIFLIASNQISI